jgi:release factor glutamine methyltransferase
MPDHERIGEAWRRASQRIDRLDARLLLEHVCACTHVDLIAHPERFMSAQQSEQFEILVARREAGEPLAYLVGSSFFSGLEFSVTSQVLIPRPDTEVLVEQAMQRAQTLAAPRIVDLGTGSGIVAILLARLCPVAVVTAVDVSAAALEIARINAARHGVQIRFLQGDWYAPLETERFDMIVSNPPYVAEGDPHLAQNGLPFEPQIALTDGGDGLACIRTLVAGAPGYLAPNGWLLIEHGYDQAVRVCELLSIAGFADVGSWRDTAGIERVSGGRWP